MGDTSQRGRVIVVGSINVDLFARVERHPRPGETVLGGDGSRKAGGKGANQAVAAALAGAETIMVGCVGDDGQRDVATAILTEAGVDLSHVRAVERVPTGVALIAVSDAGENSIIVIPGANAQVGPEDVRSAGIGAGDVVVVQGEIPVKVVDEVATAAAAAGARLVVNLAPVVALAPDTVRAADPLIVNEHEARAAARILAGNGRAGVEDDVTPVEMGVDEARALAGSLRSDGVASVIITLGGAGAVVETGEGSTLCEGERVEVVDTTGAGDCFVGTAAAHLAAGDTLEDAARAGNAAAAHAVQGAGAQESYHRR